MPTYNETQFDPPAPLAYITVLHPRTKANYSGLPMLLDTGADITLIPEYVIDALEISPVAGKSYALVGFDGTVSTAPVVQLELVLCGRIFKGRFLTIDQTWGILGRNVLNTLHLVFDGPSLSWAEYTSR